MRLFWQLGLVKRYSRWLLLMGCFLAAFSVSALECPAGTQFMYTSNIGRDVDHRFFSISPEVTAKAVLTEYYYPPGNQSVRNIKLLYLSGRDYFYSADFCRGQDHSGICVAGWKRDQSSINLSEHCVSCASDSVSFDQRCYFRCDDGYFASTTTECDRTLPKCPVSGIDRMSYPPRCNPVQTVDPEKGKACFSSDDACISQDTCGACKGMEDGDAKNQCYIQNCGSKCSKLEGDLRESCILQTKNESCANSGLVL
ncbi:hypothetical protein, partial [Zooshikella ganghwensis]|uniref:hypothetical protein n=1 Tax=Zooshikella ganghwensis TaxID=202772 RepID=UPI00056F6851